MNEAVEWASRYSTLLENDTLTGPRLATLARAFGVDVATAIFYEQLRARHRSFMDEIDAVPLERTVSGRLLVVPAAGYRQNPAYGGDGAVLRDIAQRIGMGAELLLTDSTGSVQSNARWLGERLREEREPFYIATLSKGAAELRMALEDGAPSQRILGWLNLCGLLHGCPLLDPIVSNPVRYFGLRLAMVPARVKQDVLEGFTHGDPLWSRPFVPPARIPIVNVFGCPLSSHLKGRLRTRHRDLAAGGPNDGYGYLVDSIIDSPYTYPVWGTDHYMRLPTVSGLLQRLLTWLATQGL